MARFAARASELRVESTICVDQAPAAFRAADITDDARAYPFTYPAEQQADLAPFLAEVPVRTALLVGEELFLPHSVRSLIALLV